MIRTIIIIALTIGLALSIRKAVIWFKVNYIITCYRVMTDAILEYHLAIAESNCFPKVFAMDLPPIKETLDNLKLSWHMWDMLSEDKYDVIYPYVMKILGRG